MKFYRSVGLLIINVSSYYWIFIGKSSIYSKVQLKNCTCIGKYAIEVRKVK
jgi:hypothetical protein